MKAILDLREAKAANKTQKMVRYIPKIVKNCSVNGTNADITQI